MRPTHTRKRNDAHAERKMQPENADKLYVHTVVLCTLLVLIVIAVIVGLGLYFGITKSEYQSYNKVLNATALKTGNGTSLLLNGKFYSVLPKNNVNLDKIFRAIFF